MNAPEVRSIEVPTAFATRTQHGIFIGRIRTGSDLHAIYQPPMAIARLAPARWNKNYENVDDAMSLSDGYTNTVAMAKAGSQAAQEALDKGFHIPSLDELDLQYRLFKPTTRPNYCYARSGISLYTDPQHEPHTPEFPAQTTLEEYREGAAEAFPTEWIWTSTQYRALSDCAWAQYFDDGTQSYYRKVGELPFVLVRRLIIR